MWTNQLSFHYNSSSNMDQSTFLSLRLIFQRGPITLPFITW
uniref:Uncharacterized protein n=1 Tax=Anguilla anguilla TaxID=7936 RepID=A0A0E9VCM0_ANGAN